ncbi:MAG: tetratricopeptide repeat protein [Gemmatimonadales bacterium]
MAVRPLSAAGKDHEAVSVTLPDGVTAETVRNQLANILASESFSRSDRSSRFLRFIVEHVLDGRTEPLKEYVIGVEVFDKDESFDPRVDAIVRVEAGRLRTKIKEYYGEEGRSHPVRIELAKRGYVPVFRYLPSEVGDSRSTEPQRPVEASKRLLQPSLEKFRVPWFGLAAGIVVLLLVVGVYFWTGSQPPKVEPDAEGPQGAPLQPPKFSVAVLPLKNLSRDSAEEYFSDAMTDALITSLAKINPMQVTSMTSAMHFKGADEPISKIARELNVGHIVEGSVFRYEDRVRITAQLIDGRTDKHVWAESYERAATDILALQRDVSWRIAGALAGEMLRTKSVEPTQPSTIEPAAYEAYLKGRYFRNKLSEDGFKKGVAYFQRAIDGQPDYAPAYAGMASCYCLLGGHGLELTAPREGMPKAKAAAQKALEIDSELAEPYGVLGIIRTKYDWDWDGGEKALRRALELNPSFAQGHAWYSIHLEAMGRHEEAILEAERARELDPLSLGANVNLGWQLYQAGRHREAVEQYNKTLELDPSFWGAHWALGVYFQSQGRFEEAITALKKAVERKSGHTLALSTLAYTYAVSGNRAEALKILEGLKARSRKTYVSPAHIATIYAGLGEKDQAFEWLEKAYTARSRSLAWLNVAQEWNDLRSDPRFTALLAKVGLAS